MSRRQGKPRQANTLQARLQQAKEDVIPAKNEPPIVAAKEFKFQEVISAFGLKRVEDLVQVPGQLKSLKWDIQEIPETKRFVPTPLLGPLLASYHKNFVRSSDSVCRIAIGFLLNECLTVMKKSHSGLEDQAIGHARNTPTPWEKIKVFSNVSFSHHINHPMPMGSTIINGRVDCAIGRALPYHYCGSTKHFKRRFQAFLLIVQAKKPLNVDGALPELVVYLASLRRSRLQQERTNATVYGAVYDRLRLVFVTITHEGVLKMSRRFKVIGGDTLTVLGCLNYLLEMSASMNQIIPEDDDGELVEGHGDYDPDLDIDYVPQPE